MNEAGPIILCIIIAVVIINKFRALSYVEKGNIRINFLRVIKHIAIWNYKSTKNKLIAINNGNFTNIEKEVTDNFNQKYIKFSDRDKLKEIFSTEYIKTKELLKEFDFYRIEPSESSIKLVHDYENLNDLTQRHNDNIIKCVLNDNEYFFDHCLKYPLDAQQRRSIVSEEDNCLVVSSAGSGKTSSIIGKVKYLTEIKEISPDKILLISFTNKAANEITERLGKKGLRGYTFHKLAIDIIAKATGKKPSLCESSDSLFINIYHELIKDKKFKHDIVEYYISYEEEDLNELRYEEEKQHLSMIKKNEYQALLPDMDGNKITVRSKQEQKICFILSSLGIKFRYEQPYEHDVADEKASQYRPDFSIFYEKDGKTERAYLEHLAVDEHSMVPLWFAKERGITYEEANKRYNDGITWKKEVHDKYGTLLLTSSSADFYHSDIRSVIREELENAGIPINEMSNEELFDMLIPKSGKEEKSIIRLMSTFIMLMKGSCKSIEEIIKQTETENDKRNEFIVRNIMYPVWQKYSGCLKEKNQLDFTDLILYATEICKTSAPYHWDYIVVDEFQDISTDRYNFLKVLRNGDTPARLYCVGDDWQSIYRFSGSDMSLFSRFEDYFGDTEINKIETTYRFGQPLIDISSRFIEKNESQLHKDVHPFNMLLKTDISFIKYSRYSYCSYIEQIIRSIPEDKSIFLLGRYSFDDYYLSFTYRSVKEGANFYYIICGRKIEFLTVHKSKGLESDYVILLQCNKGIYGFPSLISEDSVLDYVLTEKDSLPFGEERRLFYVAITRAKTKTFVMYDEKQPSAFVIEMLNPEESSVQDYELHRNANKRWSRKQDDFLASLYAEGKSIKFMSEKLGRSQTSIKMRLEKLKNNGRI